MNTRNTHQKGAEWGQNLIELVHARWSSQEGDVPMPRVVDVTNDGFPKESFPPQGTVEVHLEGGKSVKLGGRPDTYRFLREHYGIPDPKSRLLAPSKTDVGTPTEEEGSTGARAYIDENSAWIERIHRGRWLVVEGDSLAPFNTFEAAKAAAAAMPSGDEKRLLVEVTREGSIAIHPI